MDTLTGYVNTIQTIERTASQVETATLSAEREDEFIHWLKVTAPILLVGVLVIGLLIGAAL